MQPIRAVLFTVVIVLAAAACGDSDTPEPAVESDRSFTVVYSVTGDQDSAQLSYTYDGGTEVFRGTEPLPFSESFEMQLGDIVDLGAASDEGSTITCRIEIDSVTYREMSATDGNVALCQGQVGG